MLVTNQMKGFVYYFEKKRQQFSLGLEDGYVFTKGLLFPVIFTYLHIFGGKEN